VGKPVFFDIGSSMVRRFVRLAVAIGLVALVTVATSGLPTTRGPIGLNGTLDIFMDYHRPKRKKANPWIAIRRLKALNFKPYKNLRNYHKRYKVE